MRRDSGRVRGTNWRGDWETYCGKERERDKLRNRMRERKKKNT